MIRRILTGLLVLTLAVAGLVAQDKPASDQDPPPLRLQKKKKPAVQAEDPAKPAEKDEAKPPPAEEKKPEPRLKKDDDPPPDMPDEPEIDEQEVLNRVLKNSRTAEERLANKEVDDRTQQLQRDILKDLDSLIEQNKRSQQDQSQNQDQPQNQDQQGQKGQQGQKQQQQQQAGGMGKKGGRQQQVRGNRRGRRQMARGQGSGQEQSQQGNQQNMGKNGQGNQGGGGGKSNEEMNKLAEVYKDVWGHLPESLRAEMDAYSREEFMAKYKDVLKQYYATIAEKGRRKE